jgi:hypothetical protein
MGPGFCRDDNVGEGPPYPRSRYERRQRAELNELQILSPVRGIVRNSFEP